MSTTTTYSSITKTRYELVNEEWINPVTGEVVITPGVKSVKYGQNPYLRIDKKIFCQMTDNLGKTAHRVLNFIIWKASLSSNVCHMSGARIAKEMKLNKSALEKAMAELREADLIRSGGRCAWMLNPIIGIGCDEAYRDTLIEIYQGLPRTRKTTGGEEDVDRPDVREAGDE